MKLGLRQLWSLIPDATRREIVRDRGIKRSGNLSVVNNVIVNDGINEADLEGKIKEEEIEKMLGIKKDEVTIKEVKKIKNVKKLEKKTEEQTIATPIQSNKRR